MTNSEIIIIEDENEIARLELDTLGNLNVVYDSGLSYFDINDVLSPNFEEVDVELSLGISQFIVPIE